MLERDVEEHFKKRAAEYGGFSYKLKFLGVRGAPDRVVFLPGNPIHLVELKRPKGGVVSGIQGFIHRRLASVGYVVPILSTKWEIDAWFAAVMTSESTKTSL